MFAVKRKPTSKSLKGKREIIHHIKEASRKFGVSKMLFQRGRKKRKKTFLCTTRNFIVYQKISSCNYKEIDKVV